MDNADGDVASGSTLCVFLGSSVDPPYCPMKEPSSLNLDGSIWSYSAMLSVSDSRGLSKLFSDPALFLYSGSSLETDTKTKNLNTGTLLVHQNVVYCNFLLTYDSTNRKKVEIFTKKSLTFFLHTALTSNTSNTTVDKSTSHRSI